MSWLWVLPVLVFAAGAVVVATSVRRIADASDGLRREVNRLGQLGDEIAAVREEAVQVSEQAAELGGRLPRLRR